MKKPRILKRFSSILFLGIGGAGTSALAMHCLKLGYTVRGYDAVKSFTTERLESLGAVLYYDKTDELLHGIDTIVYSSALKKDNILVLAEQKGIPTIKRSELLGSVLDCFPISIAVSGSHGKTTVTSMLAHILIRANIFPTCFIGGEDEIYGNYAFGKGKIVLCEACEYEKNFLDLKPEIAVVTNIDDDHLDSFGSVEKEIECFKKFTSCSLSIINADDYNSKTLNEGNTVTFGIKNSAYISACDLSEKNGKYSFTVKKASVKLGRINLAVSGIHNVYDALAAVAVADAVGIDFSFASSVLESFQSVKRREEVVGYHGKTQIIADYAHHPSELSANFSSLKIGTNDVVVFQPHTYSRTRLLKSAFIKTLSLPQTVIIYKTYPAREEFDKDGSAYSLYLEVAKNKKNVHYAESSEELFALLKKFSFAERVFFFGAGDVYEIAKIYATKNE